MKKNFFPAKILLFGEYGIMQKSKALTIPYNIYYGKFSFKKHKNNFLYSNHEIKKYYKFLINILKKENLFKDFIMKDFYNDINNGIFFDSNIPKGYGIGSSGALVAGIYYLYNINNIIVNKYLNNYDLIILKNTFIIMESYFHGKSSGIDPLICYIQIPLLIKSDKNITTNIFFPIEKNKGNGAIFLINSGIPSSSSNMIKIFLNNFQKIDFQTIFKKEFILYNNLCIDYFLKGDFILLLKNIKKLSYWIYNNFHQMIPFYLKKIWKYGILTDKFYLKLCGSGGGGFFLGFTENYKIAKKILKIYHPEIIFQF